MHWYDWLALLVLAVVTVTQVVRGSKAGFGLTLLEAAAAAVVAVLATWLGTGLANLIRLNTGLVLLVVFLILAFPALVAARWLFALTGWSFRSHDGAYSIIFGLALGWVVAHMLLRVIVGVQGPRGDLAKHITAMPVAREVFQFRTWNALTSLLFTARHGPAYE
jgi:hypothetical protein